MKAVYLVMHQKKPELEALTRQVVCAFRRAGIAVTAEPWLSGRMGSEAASLFDAAPPAFDAVVSVGGDGTLLRANQRAIQDGLPLLGINMGHVGFLTEMELDQLEEACRRLQAGDYHLEERMLLEASTEGVKTLTALNDVVVSRGGYARLIAVKVWVDRELVGRYSADGIIVSTPTGSTGYSLSAGGPIVCPDVDCLILSPICAHSLQHRPVVISSRKTVLLELDCDPSQEAQLSIDGQPPVALWEKQKVQVVCSQKRTHFIRFEPKGFFSLIRYKLSEWSC